METLQRHTTGLTRAAVVQTPARGCSPPLPCDGTHTHIDDRILELDVEPVVRNGNDGFISMAKIFNAFPLENWERHLKQRISGDNVMTSTAAFIPSTGRLAWKLSGVGPS